MVIRSQRTPSSPNLGQHPLAISIDFFSSVIEAYRIKRETRPPGYLVTPIPSCASSPGCLNPRHLFFPRKAPFCNHQVGQPKGLFSENISESFKASKESGKNVFLSLHLSVNIRQRLHSYDLCFADPRRYEARTLWQNVVDSKQKVGSVGWTCPYPG